MPLLMMVSIDLVEDAACSYRKTLIKLSRFIRRRVEYDDDDDENNITCVFVVSTCAP